MKHENTHNDERLNPRGESAVPADELLNKEQLRAMLNLRSTRGVDELVRRRLIPVIVLGHRTRRFSWPDVKAAIAKVTVKSI